MYMIVVIQVSPILMAMPHICFGILLLTVPNMYGKRKCEVDNSFVLLHDDSHKTCDNDLALNIGTADLYAFLLVHCMVGILSYTGYFTPKLAKPVPVILTNCNTYEDL